MNKELEAKCPQCKKKFSYYESEFRPFCTEKCKQVDLGFWLTGSYSIPGEKLKAKNNPLELDKDFDLGENFGVSIEGYTEDEEDHEE